MITDILLYLALTLGIFFSGWLVGYACGMTSKIESYNTLLHSERKSYERIIKRLRRENDNEGWKDK